MPGISKPHDTNTRFQRVTLFLWLLPLIVPLVGFTYLALKIRDNATIGPYSVTLFVICLVWLIANLAPLFIRGLRNRILSSHFHIVAFYCSLLVAALIAEVILTVIDVSLRLPACHPVASSWWSFSPDSPPLASDFITDEVRGSRFNQPDDPNFNSQGFRDREEFSETSLNDETSLRILLIGDSFAYGSSAVNDGSNSGFADVLQGRLSEHRSENVILWNTGIPGTGQNEQALHLKRFLPILKPRYVLLAFYEGNDLNDNLNPIGSYDVFEDKTWAYRYRTVRQPPVALSPRNSWLRSQGYGVESDSLLLCFRTTSVIYRMLGNVKSRLDSKAQQLLLEQQFDATRKALHHIVEICQAGDTTLIAVVIPSDPATNSDVQKSKYDRVLGVFKELSIEHLDLRPHLNSDDYVPAPDLHWNKTGHRKAAEAILDFMLHRIPDAVAP